MLAAARRLASPTSPLLLRRRGLSAIPQPKSPPPQAAAAAEDEEGPRSWVRRAAALSLLGITGAVAVSAVRDLSVYLFCSSQAMEKATHDKQIVSAIGEPIVRGPWYNASIAVNHARHSVSCTFPVSGPQGNGLLKLKAFRLEDKSWFAFLLPSDWEILILDAILDVHTEDGKNRTIRVTISDSTPASQPASCKPCKAQLKATHPPMTVPPPIAPSSPEK